MMTKEVQELNQIAPIGGQWVRRDTPFVGKLSLPLYDAGPQVRPRREPDHSGRFSHPRIEVSITRARKLKSSVPCPGWK